MLGRYVANPTQKGDGATLPYYALDQIEPGAGGVLPGVEISGRNSSDSMLVQPGDVLFGKLRPYLSKSLLVEEYACASPELLVLRSGPQVHPKFLLYLTLAKPFVEWAVASSYGVKMPRTSWDAVKLYRGELPSIGRQKVLTNFLDRESATLDAMAKEQRQQRHLLEEADREVARRLVTGIDVAGDRGQAGPYWLGPTPTAWEPHKIAWRFLTGSGTTPASGDARYYDGTHPWLNTGECRDRPVATTARTVSDAALAEYSALKYYPAGSVVVAMYGATIGRLAMLDAPLTVNQACCVLHRATTLDPWFTFYWLWAHRPQLVSMGEGGGQPNINQELVRQLRVPAPPLPEQQEIVRAIEKVLTRNERIATEISAQLGHIAEHRQALITAAVTGQIDLNEEAA